VFSALTGSKSQHIDSADIEIEKCALHPNKLSKNCRLDLARRNEKVVELAKR